MKNIIKIGILLLWIFLISALTSAIDFNPRGNIVMKNHNITGVDIIDATTLNAGTIVSTAFNASIINSDIFIANGTEIWKGPTCIVDISGRGDQRTIQACYDAISSGKIEVRDGVYTVDNLQITKNDIWIDAVGNAQLSSSINTKIFVLNATGTTLKNIRISGFEFIDNGQAKTRDHPAIYGTGGPMYNIRLHDLYFNSHFSDNIKLRPSTGHQIHVWNIISNDPGGMVVDVSPAAQTFDKIFQASIRDVYVNISGATPAVNAINVVGWTGGIVTNIEGIKRNDGWLVLGNLLIDVSFNHIIQRTGYDFALEIRDSNNVQASNIQDNGNTLYGAVFILGKLQDTSNIHLSNILCKNCAEGIRIHAEDGFDVDAITVTGFNFMGCTGDEAILLWTTNNSTLSAQFSNGLIENSANAGIRAGQSSTSILGNINLTLTDTTIKNSAGTAIWKHSGPGVFSLKLDGLDLINNSVDFATAAGTFNKEMLKPFANLNFNAFDLFGANCLNSTYLYQNGNLVIDTVSILSLSTNYSKFANESEFWDNLDTPLDITALNTHSVAGDINMLSGDLTFENNVGRIQSKSTTGDIVSIFWYDTQNRTIVRGFNEEIILQSGLSGKQRIHSNGTEFLDGVVFPLLAIESNIEFDNTADRVIKNVYQIESRPAADARPLIFRAHRADQYAIHVYTSNGTQGVETERIRLKGDAPIVDLMLLNTNIDMNNNYIYDAAYVTATELNGNQTWIHQSYPAACPGSGAITKLGDAVICSDLWVDIAGDTMTGPLGIETIAWADPIGDTNLELFLPFTDLDSILDYSGAGLKAEKQGVVWTDNGRFGGAFVFDGDADRIRALNNDKSVLNFSIGTDFTISIWVNYTGAGDATQRVIQKDQDWMIRISGTDDLAFNVWNETASAWQTTTLSNVIPGGIWQHIVMTYDGSASILNTYLDGELQTSAVKTREPDSAFGSWTVGYTPGQDFNGTMDDIRAYSRLLSSAEIAALYSQNADYYAGRAFVKKSGEELIKIIPSTAQACNAAEEGSIYYNSSSHLFYGCNSTVWNLLG